MSDNNEHNFKFHAPGLGKTGQYQMSGIPFVSASIPIASGGYPSGPTVVEFPYVTRFVTVQNLATGSEKPLRVGFSKLGTTGSAANDGYDNYFVLDNGESYTGELRVSRLYLLGAARPLVPAESSPPCATTASVIAGLTGINPAALTTNWSGTSGVG